VRQSTGEDRELGPGAYLKVRPGESVLISSYEDIRFVPEEIHKVFPRSGLAAFCTPTTTMVREVIMQAATKVDSGWSGHLNWGLRNSSIKDFVLGFGEPIFKLTIFLLEGDEVPEVPYGKRASDLYQGTQGIARSARKVPVQIPKSKLIESSVEKIDPSRQLQEAGYPFSHIGTELTSLHGKFEIVSKDVLLLKDQFEDQTKEIRSKI
jgi:deoxycytidine triphosphate deaminase